MELHQMTGLGRVAEEKLRRAGIETPEQLREVGAKEALLRVRLQGGEEACADVLRALIAEELPIVDFHRAEMNLEKVFMEVTQNA